MKKTILLSMICFMAAGLCVTSCKKNDLKDLRYLNITGKDFLQAYVRNKKGEMVVWFQVYDRVDDKSIFGKIPEKAVEIEGYPAKIRENQWVALMVNGRIEIRVFAFGASRDFQDTDELKAFIRYFDLTGMAKITGPKCGVEELKKYIPKLDGK